MPPIATETVTFDVQDAKIAPLLLDESGGSAPTYSAWIDVPGIQQVQVNPDFITAELKGDAKTLDTRGKTSSFNLTANYALMDMDVLAAAFGGTVTNTDGVTAKWTLQGDNSVPYFRFAFSIEDVSTGVGNLIVMTYKTKITGGSLFDQQTDQYGTRSLQMSAIPTLSNDKMIDVTMYQTKTAITDAYSATS